MNPTEPQRQRCETKGCRKVAQWVLEVVEDGRRIKDPMTIALCDDDLLKFAHERQGVKNDHA